MSISSMWHVAPWGNWAWHLAPTARQTKCVCLCSSASLLCVHRQQSEKDSMQHLLAVFCDFFFFFFSFSSCETLNNLQGVWLLILLHILNETGGLLILLHCYCKGKWHLAVCFLLTFHKKKKKTSCVARSMLHFGRRNEHLSSSSITSSLHDTECDFG